MKDEGNHLSLIELDALRAGEGTAAALKHLETCDLCRREVARMEETAAVLRDIHDQVPPPHGDVEEKILARIAGRSGTFRYRRFAAAAAAVAALLLVATLFRGPEGEREKGEPLPPARVLKKTPAVFVNGSLAGDINGDRRIDADDSVALARLIAKGDEDLSRWDFNGDGRTDDEDLEYFDRVVKAEAEKGREEAFGC